MKKVFLTLVALFLISSISFVNAASNSSDTEHCLDYAERQAHALECEYGHLSDDEYEETVVFFWDICYTEGGGPVDPVFL